MRRPSPGAIIIVGVLAVGAGVVVGWSMAPGQPRRSPTSEPPACLSVSCASGEGGAPTSPNVLPPIVHVCKTLSVPGRIDPTGARDVSRPLASWIAGKVPNGCGHGSYTLVRFRAGGHYRIDHPVVMLRRQWIRFDGQGAVLDGSQALAYSGATWMFDYGNHLQLINLTIVGNNHTPPPGGHRPQNEWDANIHVANASAVLIDHVTGTRASGDGVSIGPTHGCRGIPPHNVTVQNSSFGFNGRMSISVDASSRITLQANTLGPSGFSLVDLEDEFAGCGWGIHHVYLRGNHLKWTALIGIPNGGGCAPQHDIYIRGNVWDQAPRLSDLPLISVETPAGCAPRFGYYIERNGFRDPVGQHPSSATISLSGLREVTVAGNTEVGGGDQGYAIATERVVGLSISDNRWTDRSSLLRNDGNSSWSSGGNTCGLAKKERPC